MTFFFRLTAPMRRKVVRGQTDQRGGAGQPHPGNARLVDGRYADVGVGDDHIRPHRLDHPLQLGVDV